MEATSSILPFRVVLANSNSLSPIILSLESPNYPRKISNCFRQSFPSFMILLAKKYSFLCIPESAHRPYGTRSGMLMLPAELTRYSHGLGFYGD